LLLAQLIAMGMGMALLVRRAVPSRAALALALFCAFLLAPPVWSIGVTLWKDVLVGTALLGAVAALDTGRPMLALALSVLGTLCRHNAVVAAVPLALPAVNQMVRDRRGRILAGTAAIAL